MPAKEKKEEPHPDAIFQQTRVAKAQDTDIVGHVNNVVWLQFVVDLAEAHCHSVGLDFETFRSIGGVWIARRHEIDYHADALEGETLVCETWLEPFRGARSVRHTRFKKESDGTQLVSCTTHWAYIDVETGRPRRVDKEILERLSPPPPSS